jgi:dihydroorotase
MILIKNATLYGRTSADTETSTLHHDAALLMEGDLIAGVLTAADEIAAAERRADEVIDAEGGWLLPGAIDAHVHFREPGLTAKADIASESRAAVAGGVTTVLDMPNVKPTTTTPEALAEKGRLFAARSEVNYGLYYGITHDNIESALQLPEQSFCGYKVFLGSSTGGMLMDDPTLLRRLLGATQRVIAVHSESEPIIRRNAEHYRALWGDAVPVTLHPRIRSREACIATTRDILRLAHETGAQLHLCHLTTADEVALCPTEANITTEACVAHLWFTDADYERLGARIKCNPAIKSAADRDALRRGLTDGRITLVATDHAPHLISDKQGGALQAASGMPSVQYSLLAMLELMHQGICTLADVVRLMAEAPARRYRIRQRGILAPGYKADVVWVQPHAETVVTSAGILSKCGWSPFEGTTFHHHIAGVWVGGRKRYDGTQIVDGAPGGEALSYDL